MNKNLNRILLVLLFFSVVAPVFIVNIPEAKAGTSTYTFTPTQDTFTAEDAPGTTYAASPTLFIGGTAGAAKRAFLEFDTSSLAGKFISTATLSLDCLVNGETRTLVLKLINQSWTAATLNWTNQPTAFSSLSVSKSVAATGLWTANITSLVYANATLGFTIYDSAEGSGAADNLFESSENGIKPTLTVVTETGPYFYIFHGVLDESTGLHTTAVNVTAYFASATAETFEVDGNRTKGLAQQPLFFDYDLEPHHRQYWVDSLTNYTDIYIYNDTTTNYVINFLDYTGILATYPYVTASVNTNGASVVVEKRKVDVQGSVSMSLVNGRKYTIMLGTSGATYTFGDLLMTASTGIQLTIKGSDFPKDSLLTQKYVHIYSTRSYGSPNGFITTTFNDESLATTSTTITIRYINGTTAYTTTSAAQSWTINWTSALNNTAYYLTAVITHATYGTLTYRQTFLAEGSHVAPWGLGWMGSLAINTAYLFPAILILFVAGCFSALNAEVGAVLVSVMAIILTVMGWIPIPAGALVAAMFLSILMALIYNKRRVSFY